MRGCQHYPPTLPDGQWAVGDDPIGECNRRIQCAAVRHKLVDQTELGGASGRNGIARGCALHGQVLGDLSGQTEQAARAGN